MAVGLDGELGGVDRDRCETGQKLMRLLGVLESLLMAPFLVLLL